MSKGLRLNFSEVQLLLHKAEQNKNSLFGTFTTDLYNKYDFKERLCVSLHVCILLPQLHLETWQWQGNSSFLLSFLLPVLEI